MRWIWVFRVAFYGGAVVLLSLKLTGALDPASADGSPEGHMLRGHTSQGSEMEMYTVDGRAWSFAVDIAAVCPDGSRPSSHWSPSDTERVPFDHGDGELLVTERRRYPLPDGNVGVVVWSLGGRLDDGKASGTARVVSSYDYGDGVQTSCDSGDVSWSITR